MFLYIVTPKKSCTTRNRPFAEYTRKKTPGNNYTWQNNAKTLGKDGGHMFPLATCDGEETVC